MAHGWEDGDEPWNDTRYYPSHATEEMRRDLWWSARNEYRAETGSDTTLNENLFPGRAAELGDNKQEPLRMECFVATAAFESIEHKTVDTLRQYRDQVLMNSAVGQKAVQAYYSGVGELGARVLNAMPSAKPMVRGTLNALVDHVISPLLENKQDTPYK